MIFYLDTEQRYRSYNETFMKWFGVDDKEAIGKTVQEFIGREAYRKVTPHLARAYTGQQVRYEMEAPLRVGKRNWLSIVYTPHINEEGRVLGIIVHATDITHSKETEIALRESERRYRYLNETLEAQVSQRTAELQRSNEDLQQFAHVASHDLKEPVRKIRTFGNRLGHEFSDILPEKAKTYIAKMESAADRMATMIDGVLNYSTINASTQTLQQVDLNEVIKSIETDLEVIILNTGTTIEYSGLPTVEGAHVLLYQLFYNLVNNSIKFAKAGVSPRILISSERMVVNDKVFSRIIVKDNGIGFEESYSKSIFDTFTRLNSKDKYDGTGLGLSLCKKIVERHGGTIEASGVKDEGATISVLLPLQQTTETI
jgi:PAS domain S-box-containing protein